MATGKLRQVEEDAMRINARRFRDQEEDRQYEDLKNKPTEDEAKSPEEVLAEVQSQNSETAVKAAVELVSAENVKRAKESADKAEDEAEVSVPKPEVKDSVKPLNKLNKTELQEVADEEGVEVAKDATNAELVSAIEASREDKE